ncbi:MAG: zinc ribbon domain-containing protein [Deltaproteobacteria bacterium]|nr:zinc ribbon domain-containing protein [Deltaproteobacteria bacterium]MBW1817368.1 zinc ribbon domain-containing protein [Deltaproteobacteria bacterium]
MPVYEYECKKCGSHTEALQRFSDAPLTECESCHGRLQKLISQSTFHLKGSGWYVTDYASKSGENQGKDSKPKSDTKSDTKSDKPSAKSTKSKDAPTTAEKPAKTSTDK